MIETSDERQIWLFADGNGTKTSISFSAPRTDVMFTKDITDYRQETRCANGSGWSGGGFADGFIFMNRLANPNFIEVHALERADCSCRHLLPYFANGIYVLR